jgi:hypothetical protein
MSITSSAETLTALDLTRGQGGAWVGLTSLGMADPKDFAWDGTNETVRGSGYAYWCSRNVCPGIDEPAGVERCGVVGFVNGLWFTASCDSFTLSMYMVEFDCD